MWIGHEGWGIGGALGMSLVMLAFWALVILGVALAVRALNGREETGPKDDGPR